MTALRAGTITVLLAVCFSHVHAGLMEDDMPAVSTGRTLSQYRPPESFPYARCTHYPAAETPYTLSGPNVTISDKGIASFTFRLHYKGPNPNAPACYQKLEQSLHKIMFHVYTECVPAIQVPKRVYVNGVRRTFFMYQHPLGTTLSITALKLNSTTAEGAEVTIESSSPCDAVRYFFVPRTTNPPGPISAIFTESSGHQCCGRDY